jgi:hypothetical protein
VVRDCRKLHDDLTFLLERGDIGIVAKPLLEIAVAAAVTVNSLAIPPRSRVVSDTLAHELERRLDELDEGIAETLLLPA